MKNQTISPDEDIWITVESTTNIQAWAPVLFKMKGESIIEVHSPVEFNDNGTRVFVGSTDQILCGFQICTNVREFKKHLKFFAERTRQGDIISVWEFFVSELQDLLDEIAESDEETNNLVEHTEKEIERSINDKDTLKEIKSSSVEELAEQLKAFAKKEFQNQRVPMYRISELFWESKTVGRWGLPATIQLKIEKANALAKSQLLDEGIPEEIKSARVEELAEIFKAFAKKEFLDQRASSCKIYPLFFEGKNVKEWEFPVDLRLKIEKADTLARDQLMAERAVKDKDEVFSLVDPCVEWAKKYALKKVTEADLEAFILERDLHDLTRAKKMSLRSVVNNRLRIN